jgi:hypothetical protein
MMIGFGSGKGVVGVIGLLQDDGGTCEFGTRMLRYGNKVSLEVGRMVVSDVVIKVLWYI